MAPTTNWARLKLVTPGYPRFLEPSITIPEVAGELVETVSTSRALYTTVKTAARFQLPELLLGAAARTPNDEKARYHGPGVVVLSPKTFFVARRRAAPRSGSAPANLAHSKSHSSSGISLQRMTWRIRCRNFSPCGVDATETLLRTDRSIRSLGRRTRWPR